MTKVTLYSNNEEGRDGVVALTSWTLGDPLPDLSKWLPEGRYRLGISSPIGEFWYYPPRGPLSLTIPATIDEHQGGPKRQPSYTEPKPELIATVLNRIEGKLDKLIHIWAGEAANP